MGLTDRLNRQGPLERPRINTNMQDKDSQDFLDSVMVFERETIPVEFYGNPGTMLKDTGTVESIKGATYIEVPEHALQQLDWPTGCQLQWDVVDQETVVITVKRR